MTAREELAQSINKALGDVTGIYDTSEDEDLGIADALLAEGWGKVCPEANVKVTFGLRHPNGYVFEANDQQHALDLKAGKIIHGKPGAWAHHELVKREHRTQVTAWEPQS